jgi:hypothetical protein
MHQTKRSEKRRAKCSNAPNEFWQDHRVQPMKIPDDAFIENVTDVLRRARRLPGATQGTNYACLARRMPQTSPAGIRGIVVLMLGPATMQYAKNEGRSTWQTSDRDHGRPKIGNVYDLRPGPYSPSLLRGLLRPAATVWSGAGRRRCRSGPRVRRRVLWLVRLGRVGVSPLGRELVVRCTG